MIAEARYFLPSIFSFLIDELLVSNFYNYTLQLTHLSLAQVCVSRNNCPLRYLTKILLLVNNNLVLLQRHSVYNDCKKYWHTPFSFNEAFLRQVLPFVFVTWNVYLSPNESAYNCCNKYNDAPNTSCNHRRSPLTMNQWYYNANNKLTIPRDFLVQKIDSALWSSLDSILASFAGRCMRHEPNFKHVKRCSALQRVQQTRTCVAPFASGTYSSLRNGDLETAKRNEQRIRAASV